jgi:hypothetical protein
MSLESVELCVLLAVLVGRKCCRNGDGDESGLA